MADASVFPMNLPDDRVSEVTQSETQVPLLNVGCGEDLTIAELAETIRDVVGFKGKLAFDRSKPDGTPRKLLDVSRVSDLCWNARIPLCMEQESVYQELLRSRSSFQETR